LIKSLIWKDKCLSFIDQRRLPSEQIWCCCESATCVANSIREMVVRGAPAIGIAAAYGVVLAAIAAERRGQAVSIENLSEELRALRESRPTAVNLFWAMDRMEGKIQAEPGMTAQQLLMEAKAIHDEDIAANRAMGQHGAALIEPGSRILTHCNTGALATGGHGTALGVIRSAWALERVAHVYVDETRPWLQGARLTMWELMQERIPSTLICEGAAASLMRSGKVNWVIVGADRIAANGDTANKIGTYSLAVLARHHGVRFMVVAPMSTIDYSIDDGTQIPIETRPEVEVTSLAGREIAPPGASAWNPSFDVTPAELIDAIVTEKGVVTRPNRSKMASLCEGQ